MQCTAIAAESTQGSGLEFSPNKGVCFRNLLRNSKLGELKAFLAHALEMTHLYFQYGSLRDQRFLFL